MTQFPENTLPHFADYVQSTPTFWQYADSGADPGNQDYFNDNDNNLE